MKKIIVKRIEKYLDSEVKKAVIIPKVNYLEITIYLI